MLTLTFFVALVVLALAVGLTPLGGWVKPAVWLALALLLSLLVALKAVVLRAAIPLALVGALGMSGCCGTSRCYIARAQTALEASDPIALKAIGAVCKPRVEAECKGKGEACEAFQKCTAALVGYQAARKTVGTGLVELNRALAEIGVK